MKTYGEQLSELQIAIEAVQMNQYYKTTDGREYRRADLESMHKREKYLEDKLIAYGNVSPMSLAESRGAYHVVFK